MGQAIPWGMYKIGAPESSTVSGNGSGAINNVNAYVIDSGIAQDHPDLNVVRHVNLTGLDGGGMFDCKGHGTHVAGIIGARDNVGGVVGVAPGIKLTAVKVLDCNGIGSESSVLAGIDWVTANAIRPAVANMSLGEHPYVLVHRLKNRISPPVAMSQAIRRSAASGIVYSIAAGNENLPACNVSKYLIADGAAQFEGKILPHNGIMNVGATKINNQASDFSNYGNCVSVWAPGTDIYSTRLGGGAINMSGTSMAAPHVAGAAALYLSRNPGASPGQVERAIRSVLRPMGTYAKDGAMIEQLNVRHF